jgi:hypothetical protein
MINIPKEKNMGQSSLNGSIMLFNPPFHIIKIVKGTVVITNLSAANVIGGMTFNPIFKRGKDKAHKMIEKSISEIEAAFND